MADRAPTVVWFRKDLRLDDNPALQAAIARGAPIVSLFVLDDETAGDWRPGGASRWWLHHSLDALSRCLAERGAPLVLRRGHADQIVPQVVAECGATAVYWNRCYEPFAIERDRRLKASLKDNGIEAQSFNASLLHEPWTVETKSGEPFKVFTPFWKALRERGDPPAPQTVPARLAEGAALPSDRLESWALLPTTPDWAGGLRESWSVGEAAARERLSAFLENGLAGYGDKRNRPDLPFTSRLSPHLAWGEIGPRQIWHWTMEYLRRDRTPGLEDEAWGFLRELGWREFSYHLLYHWPDLPETAWKPAFGAFPWNEDEAAFHAWCQGKTGYPIVDAAMRELYATGWMHNRMRMVTASFLIKDLLIPWQRGEAWFWDTLVDADLANNAASWQWVAGSGADAAPYFRIFNPVRQGETFDPDGTYVRRWVPELAGLSNSFIHRPWEAPDAVLSDAGVELDSGYPWPLVDHKAARDRALAAYTAIGKGAA